MNEMWNGTVTPCHVLAREVDLSEYKWVVATREPVDHFLSGYKEMLYRVKLWENPEHSERRVPKESKSFLKVLDGWEVKRRLALRKSSTPEDLKTKNKMLEIFVQEWDGKNVFDEHLGLQAIKLRHNNNKMFTFDDTLDSENLSEEMAQLARIIGAPVPPPVKKRSHAGEPLEVSLASEETIRKICHLRAQDFCCMNYELPEVCQKVDGIGERVQCEWTEQSDKSLAIKPVFLPGKEVSRLKRLQPKEEMNVLPVDESQADENDPKPEDKGAKPSSDAQEKDRTVKASGEKNQAKMPETAESDEKIPKAGDRFDPGTLALPRHEIIPKCKCIACRLEERGFHVYNYYFTANMFYAQVTSLKTQDIQELDHVPMLLISILSW
jgi:hypothetical protein